MRRVGSLILGLIVTLAGARALLFLTYAVFGLSNRFETYDLEAKMVLLAYRTQAGESLYPSWQNYPHVSNFYGPIYFAMVGLVGRAVGADVSGLFLLGRAVTFLSVIGTTILIGWDLSRRFGRGATVAGTLMSLGAAPMIGFSVMVRPDMTAEMLGFGGFLASGLRTRRGFMASCALLVMAILTKQTAILFLVAAVMARYFQGERRRALGLLLGSLTPLAAIVGLVSIVSGPYFLSSLLGDSSTPWDYASWSFTMNRLTRMSPDHLVIPMLGLILWGLDRPRDVPSLSLGMIFLAAGLVLAAKQGSDLNYFMSLRIVEALAVGTLGHKLASLASLAHGLVAAMAATLAVGVCLPSVKVMAVQAESSCRLASDLCGPTGRSLDRTLTWIRRKVEDPTIKVLTDSPMIELFQKERAAFGDPFLFRLQVETGQIQPVTMKRWIDAEAYDLIITRHDIFSPRYASFAFGLPMALVERAKVHYVPAGSEADLHFYRRRGSGPAIRSFVASDPEAQSRGFRLGDQRSGDRGR